jgi:filamentous hemagglutinin
MRVRTPSSVSNRIGHGVLACLLGSWMIRAAAGVQLPVPCAAANCGTHASGFVSSGAATSKPGGNTLTVNQTTNNATLNWASFNIGAGGRVVFQQPSANAIALNRIFDANPSSIFGALTANGQIYLINANGFLFGSTARVNVAGLIASSLNITDQTFGEGILQTVVQADPALQSFTDAAGNPLLNTGSVTVQNGAQLVAADGGRLLLAAPTVQNAGSLSAPDGQIVLAAGQQVYLQAANNDPSLRGLIVEVDGAGAVANQLTGQLSTPRGNVTLAALMVNQDGRVSATTSVAANGSVTLQAADGFNYNKGGTIEALQGGTAELGPSSVTEILPEYTDTTTAVAAQQQLQSTVSITGQQVLMHGGTIDAPSGVLNVLAQSEPSTGQIGGVDPQAEIRIDSGTTIDLAGSMATLPMSANLVTVQLRSNEFADDPTQRGGVLEGQTVTVDMRADGGLGTPIADVSSAIAAVGQNIAQRTETGGTVNFQSAGDIVFNPGAAINVSGGATTYQAGSIQTTTLVGVNGQLYDIGSASPLTQYVGLINPTFTQSSNKWGTSTVIPTPGLSSYESAYQQGAAAGSIQFSASSLVLGGALKGTAINGEYQRTPSTQVSGGTLTIGVPAGVPTNNPSETDFFSPAVTLTSAPIPIVVADGTPLPVQSLQLPTSYLTSDGFTDVHVVSNSNITLPAGLPLALPPGQSLTFEAARIDIDSSVTDPGGALSFVNTLTTGAPIAGRAGIGIGSGVTLDVSGQWTNDSVLTGGLGSGLTLQNGGSINLQLTAPSSELVLGNDAALKANGSAWVNATGSITYGNGGAITLDASPSQSAIQFGQDTVVQAFGTGTATGGTFSLSVPRIDISQGSGKAWTTAQRVDDLTATGEVLELYAPLFSSEGFSSINLTATGGAAANTNGDVLTVSSGTVINAQPQTLQLDSNFESMSTGAAIASFSQPVLLPLYQRLPTSVSLSVVREPDDVSLGDTNFGNLDIQQGASILTNPGGSISLVSEGSLSIAGTLRAQGGAISALIIDANTVDSGDADLVDPGYQPTQSLTLAPSAVLDAGGTAILTPNTQGLLQGTVSSGGSVSLVAQHGTVITDAGSMIDIAGTSATLDLLNTGPFAGYSSQVVASAGGSLTVSSAESISLLGSLKAAAGVGTSGAAAAGSVEVDLVRPAGTVANGPQLPGSLLEIELVDSTSGASPSPPDSNIAVLGAAQLAASGIDALILRAGGDGAHGNIQIDAGQLSLGRELILDTPSLTVSSNATLSAPYVAIGNSNIQGESAQVPTPAGGSGTLRVSSQQLTLYGSLAILGTSSVTLESAGDVQLEGTQQSDSSVPNPNNFALGSLVTSGNLTIDAARVYPDTYTSFTLQTQGSGATLSIGQTSASPGSPLSADGSVTLSADRISITGTLLAPFGSIDLDATTSINLGPQSLVSVSGAGLDVPFGETQLNEAQWVYEYPLSTSTFNQITGVPAKQIDLTAPQITLAKGSQVDLQGGGDLYAYEWVPGTGGTHDNLSSVYGGPSGPISESSIPNLYAIIPAERGQAAPYDPEESSNSIATETVYLSGGAGIAAGYYALLPPRYALAPGAMLIQLQPGYTSASGGQIGTLANGTPVIAGYLSSAGTGLHTGYSGISGSALTEYEGFAVYPGSYGQEISAYTISSASSYFAGVAATAGTGPVAEPADGGTLSLSVTAALGSMAGISNSLDLQGTVQTAAASGGRGAEINISAPNLVITNTPASAGPGAIVVSGSVLQSWNASSLTFGGTAVNGTGTTSGGATVPVTNIAVAANSVTVDAGVTLTADQIDLVAQQSIDVQAGAALYSTSGRNGKVLATAPALTTVNLTDSSGNPLPQAALLAVSDLALPVVERGTGNAPGGATITVAGTLSSGGALAVDAPGAISLSGALEGRGASWSFSSSSVGLGNGAPAAAGADTLSIGAGLLSSLEQAGAVRIASEGGIDLDGPVTLGVDSSGTAPTLSSLTLIGTGINNLTGANSTFGGASLTLGGSLAGSGADSSPAGGAGELSFVANTLTVGPGTLAVNGFARTTAQVAGAVQTQGSGGLAVGGNLTINAVELNPAPDAQDELGTTISATGTLTLGKPTTLAAGTTLPTLVGGNLTLSASDIEDAGAILAPSGIVTLTSSGDLHLASTASINTAGTLLHAVGQTAASPGGLVSLSAVGNVALDAGSKIDVAGSTTAPAGSLSITALPPAGSAITAGTVTIGSTLLGAANGGSTGGSFTLDAGTLTGGLTPLASNLMAGGFSDSVNIRVRGGDLDLTGGASLTANSITLSADSGAVDIAGALSAPSAALRGLIDLSAGTGVTLAATGQLHADGTASNARGGEIDINSICPTCTITLDGGSVVSTAGSAQMGELVLRAPVFGTDDVAINLPGTTTPGTVGIGADVSRAGQVIVEPVTVFQETNGANVNNDLSTLVTAASTFLSTATGNITARLSSAANPISVQAGVELQDSNPNDSLTLQGLDLSTLSTPATYGGAQAPQVVNLTVRAAGSIAIDGTISDGFVAGPNGLTALSTLPSASLTFVAGADTSAANPLSLLPASSVNPNAALTLNGIVRSGTGDVSLAAAGDVVFGSGGAAYTGGLATVAPVLVRVPGSSELLNFATDGGNVRLVAGGNVTSAPVSGGATGDNGDFSVTGWLLTQGNSTKPVQYGTDFDAFDWDLGALGGGDVSVLAGQQVNNLSAAVADSYVSAQSSGSGRATLLGAGGGLNVSAQGDIGSAQIYVADGVGTLTTGGGLTPILSNGNGGYVGSAFALGDSQISVWARQGAQVDALYNPTFLPQPYLATGPSAPAQFFTYGSASAFNLSSTDGEVTLEINPSNTVMGVLLGQTIFNAPVQIPPFGDLPTNISLHSLQQDLAIDLAGDAIMFPSSTGQLVLYAGRDILGGQGALAMADSLPATVPTAANPVANVPSGNDVVGGLSEFQGVIHTGDPEPALITAGRDIDDLQLDLPKAAQISAGRDILGLQYYGQNASASDTTLITAGRDIAQNGTGAIIQVAGQGSLDVLAGRNVNLGVSQGITTIGNLKNGNLPSTGADLGVAVGYGTLGADYAAFVSDIIAPSSAYQADLIAYVEAQSGDSGLTFAQAQKVFATYSATAQAGLVDGIFYNELLLSGRAANSGTGVGFAEGYAAIDALYPASRNPTTSSPNPYSGVLNLVSSQIYTLSGGSISILVPGGSIDVGLAFTPPTVSPKPASELGIVAEGAGNVDIYSLGNVNVNASRIFTLGGGNILIWSDLGSIDAGNGSKSSLSVPPPTIVINSDGTISLDYGASLAQGSGIRTIQTNPDVPPGNVDLDAPVGTVNAGDAGIGAAGNINIAAARVIGVENINFGGTATGVPPELSGLGAALAGASSAVSSATTSATSTAVTEANAARETAPLANSALSWLDVFVTGLGEENCKPDDIECLKRQKTATP